MARTFNFLRWEVIATAASLALIAYCVLWGGTAMAGPISSLVSQASCSDQDMKYCNGAQKRCNNAHDSVRFDCCSQWKSCMETRGCSIEAGIICIRERLSN
jgi:hypothetical protein